MVAAFESLSFFLTLSISSVVVPFMNSSPFGTDFRFGFFFPAIGASGNTPDLTVAVILQA